MKFNQPTWATPPSILRIGRAVQQRIRPRAPCAPNHRPWEILLYRIIKSVFNGPNVHWGRSLSIAAPPLTKNGRCRVILPRSDIPSQGADLQFIEFNAAYLQRLQSHDVGTEKHFVAYFSELIQLKLRSRLNSKEAIEDVRQETFLRVIAVLHSKEGVKQPERLGALVNTVCNFVLLEHYRAKNKNTLVLDDEPETRFTDHDSDPSRVLEAQDAEFVVRKVLAEISERDRQLLKMVLLEERDKDEVCAELGLSRDYLRVLVHRAKLAFKSYYLKRAS